MNILRILFVLNLVLVLYSSNFAQAVNVPAIQDEQLMTILSSTDLDRSSAAAIEIFNRGERMLPLLMKMKGNRTLSFASCLGDPLAAMGTRGPSEEATRAENDIEIKKGRLETLEVASLYLISAIYYDNLTFAQVTYLTGNRKVKNQEYNTFKRVGKAWKATEKWYKDLNRDGMKSLRTNNNFPLKTTEVHFYGTDPSVKRSLSDDCLRKSKILVVE